MGALQESVKAPALYLFPGGGMDAPPDQQEAAMKAWSEAYRRGPRGLLIYEPTGGSPSMASFLLTQLGFCVVVCLIAAWGNWYSFPSHYTLMALVDRTVGMTAAGLVIARLVKS